jgi:hypothetical protein
MDIPFFAAVPGGGILWLGVISTTLGPWLKPERFEGRRLLRMTGVSFLLGVIGAACGILLVTFTRHDGPRFDRFASATMAAVPLIVGVVALLLLVQWGVASWRRHVLAQEVERLQLVHERDQAKLLSQHAELRVLHVQIQPHFIFNTLAALQHWVDNGDPRAGPLLHTLTEVIQFATADDAFIVQTAAPDAADFLRAMIESDDIVRVGFGLASDKPQIHRKLGLKLGKSIDVSFMVRRLGFAQAVGLKTAVAVVLGQRFPKSKRVTTSNSANPELSAQQLQYAANDAHASLMVFRALSG